MGLLYEGRHLSLSLRRKITANVFFIQRLQTLFIFVTFFLFLTFFIFVGTFFHLCIIRLSQQQGAGQGYKRQGHELCP